MADDNPMISGLRARAGQRRKRGGKRFFFPAVRRGRRKEVSLSAQIPFLVSPMSCARCRDPARVMRAQFLPATATRMQFIALRSSTRKSGYARFDPAHNNRAHDREKMRSDFRARPRANRICAAVTNKKNRAPKRARFSFCRRGGRQSSSRGEHAEHRRLWEDISGASAARTLEEISVGEQRTPPHVSHVQKQTCMQMRSRACDQKFQRCAFATRKSRKT